MSSSTNFESVFSLPIAAMEYRDIAGHVIADAAGKSGTRSANNGNGNGNGKSKAEVELTKAELAETIQRERAEAAQQVEQKLRQEFEAKLQAARAPITAAVATFEVKRAEYFARVEVEVVQLALAIAAKILHREAQVEPMLIAALVKMTLEKMREGSSVTVRVGPGRARQWKDYFAGQPSVSRVEVAEDAELSGQDCLLETELGVANFGLDTQLKEVEQGFFDLLALRPETK